MTTPEPQWRVRFDALEEKDKQERLAAVARVEGCGQPLRLNPLSLDAWPIWMMVGKDDVGTLSVSRRDGFVWIDNIVVHGHLERHGFGRQAIDALAELARKDGFALIRGEIAPGLPEDMEGRRMFFRKCGFTVNAHNVIERPIGPKLEEVENR